MLFVSQLRLRRCVLSLLSLLLAPSALYASAAGELADVPTHSPSRVFYLGLMLPATGAYQATGEWIRQGLELALDQVDGQVAGRALRLVSLDSQSNPLTIDQAWQRMRATPVSAIIAPVHPGGALRVAALAREDQQLVFIPGSGLNRLTRRSCAPSVFRTAYTNDQQAETIARYVAAEGFKRVAAIAWRHPNGVQLVDGFDRFFQSVDQARYQAFYQPYPLTDFESLLDKVSAFKPDIVYAAVSGPAAEGFFRQRASLDTLRSVPVIGPGMLTSAETVRQLAEAQGALSVSSYADDYPSADNFAFRALFKAATGRWPNDDAVYGFDTGKVVIEALRTLAAEGLSDEALIPTIHRVSLPYSPRGAWRFSPQNSPVLPMYLRELRFGQNRILATLSQALADSGKHCKGFDPPS